ncbi:MAG: hypothetical protein KIT76_13750 [Pseudolabrys sp.]|jgi:hypothetical protein|nr:hypothetical protein [Pseudolabrys sp.]
MVNQQPTAPESGAQVIRLRRPSGSKPSGHGNTATEGPAADDLAKYSRDETPDDYRQRMIVNAAALAFVALLGAAGLWLADTMASMRKNQDCVLTGRRGCSPVDVPVRSRY